MSLFDASFFKRLGFFMFGLAIGIIFLAFFLKKKTEATGSEFCYFPNCRVLKDLRSKPLSFDDRTSAMLANDELDTLDIEQFFVNGEVLFNRSDTDAVPCKRYLIEGKINLETVVLEVDNCADKVVVVGLK